MLLNVLGCQLTYHFQGQDETNAEAWLNIALRPRKPEGSLGRTAQDGHLDSHTAPELRLYAISSWSYIVPLTQKRPRGRLDPYEPSSEVELKR